ncbi:ubiquitinyl hydrolase [Aureococcus anophagefferens]|nr:ubiquitinyl hydrolase [Aureococcus anophagefferens]
MKFAADEPKVCGACGSSNATKICGNCKEQPYCSLECPHLQPLAGYLLEVEVGNAPTKRGFNMMFELARHVRKVWSRNEMLSRCEPIAPVDPASDSDDEPDDGDDGAAAPGRRRRRAPRKRSTEARGFQAAPELHAPRGAHGGRPRVPDLRAGPAPRGLRRRLRRPDGRGLGAVDAVHGVFECTLGQAVVCGACGFHSKAHSVELALRLNATLGLSPEELAKASAKDESPGLGGLAEKSPWKNKAATRAALRIGAAGGRREDTTPPTDVVELLELFFASETIDGYKCDECDQKSTCEKIAGFYQTPNALALYVDRVPAFGALFGKLNRKVAFDETLDLEPFLAPGAPANADETYRLFGVVCHLDVAGSTFFGHYICHVRDSNGEWWSLDDERVIPSDWDHVKDASPYLLFYARNAPHLSPRLTPPKQEPSAKAKARAAKAGAP